MAIWDRWDNFFLAIQLFRSSLIIVRIKSQFRILFWLEKKLWKKKFPIFWYFSPKLAPYWISYWTKLNFAHGFLKISRNRRNGTKQEKHSGKGIAIALATVLFLNFSVKSLSKKVQKFWGEVSVLSLLLNENSDNVTRRDHIIAIFFSRKPFSFEEKNSKSSTLPYTDLCEVKY